MSGNNTPFIKITNKMIYDRIVILEQKMTSTYWLSRVSVTGLILVVSYLTGVSLNWLPWIF